MSNPLLTPNMSLTEPAIGSTYSPVWAQLINADLGILDQHNHEPGSGKQIPPAGLNISYDLTFQGNNATNLRTVRFTPTAVGGLLGTDVGVLLENNNTSGDLYYVNAAGLQIQITNSLGIVGASGSISGLISPASATYVSATDTFVWQSGSGIAANMDAATYILRYPSTGYPTPAGNYIALQAPSTLATGYAVTFPATLPSSTSFITESTSGQLAYVSTTAGITGSMIAAATITGSNIAANTVSGSNIVSSVALAGSPTVAGSLTVGGTIYAMGNSVLFEPNNTQLVSYSPNTLSVVNFSPTSNYPIVTNAPGLTNGDTIIRGQVSSSGVAINGIGYTASGSGGRYTITFNTSFVDTPAVIVTPFNSAGNPIGAVTTAINTSSFAVTIFTTNTGAASAQLFSFIAIGQRSN